jgi:hypothetical protein
MAQLYDAFGTPLMRRKQSHLTLATRTAEQPSASSFHLRGKSEVASPKAGLPPENSQLTDRKTSPTFQSRVFEGSNYDNLKEPEFRNKPIAERRLQRDNSDKFLRSLRVSNTAGSKSASNLHVTQPAGQISRNSSRKKMFEDIVIDRTPNLLAADGQYSPAAGIKLKREEGTLILNAGKVDHVEGLIKSPDKIKPATSMDTAYNGQFSRKGFEPCHTPEKKPEPQTKVVASQVTYHSPKRFPNEVKSSR